METRRLVVVILNAAKNLCSLSLKPNEQTTAEILRCAQDDS